MNEIGAIASAATDIAINEIVSIAPQDLYPIAAQVKTAARELITIALQLKSRAGNSQAEKMLEAYSQNKGYTPTEMFKFTRQSVQSEEDFEKIMNAVFKLQDRMNNLLDQKIQMIFAYEDGSGHITLYEMDNTAEHLTIGKHRGAFSGRYMGMKSILEQMKDRQLDKAKEETRLDPTYQEVYRRYTISKNRMKKAKSSAIILWKTGGAWSGVKVSSAGVLSEAYVNFYIWEYEFSSDIEQAVGQFMMEGTMQVDNISGFLQGDISKDGVEYGVKSAGASAMGYSQIIKYAQEILMTPDEYLKDYALGLKEYLAGKGKTKLASEVKNAMLKTAEELIDPINAYAK